MLSFEPKMVEYKRGFKFKIAKLPTTDIFNFLHSCIAHEVGYFEGCALNAYLHLAAYIYFSFYY